MKPLSKYSSRGSAVQELKISSLRLVRNAACKYDHEERPEFRNRGRKVCFTIEIKNFAGNSGIVERDLSGIEALLSQAGWENDTCPLYDEGYRAVSGSTLMKSSISARLIKRVKLIYLNTGRY
jgi:hypothetical protein